MAIQKKQVVLEKDLLKYVQCACAHYIVKTAANNVILFLTLSKKGKILVYRIELHIQYMIVATTIFYRLPHRSIYFVEGTVGEGGGGVCVPV